MTSGRGGLGGFVARLLGRDIVAQLRSERERLSADLSRRLVELNSLQELSQALSASLRFDHVVAEVARYAMRALDGSGAVVILAPEDGGAFEVAAANGTLAGHMRRRIDPESGGLALSAMIHERLELHPRGSAQVDLFTDARAWDAVVAPLRAHGLTVGAIAVVDRLAGTFSAEDGRLLSTAASHAAVVFANARFFELMRVGKEQWEATFDALAEGIALVDAAGMIRRANTAIAAMLGQPITRVVGRHLGVALFGEKGGVDALVVAARGEHPSPVVRRSDPLGRTLRLHVSSLDRPTAEATAVVVVEDITEQKALESQLMQSEKLVAVGTMVSGVAHELNNPLTSIAGLSELLLEQEGAGGAHAEHLKVIYDQAERASRIVRNLLSFARKSTAESAPLDLGDVAMRTVTLMSYEMRQAGVTVETNIQADLPPVLGSRDQLQQVVLNLLTNAAYALGKMPAGAPRRIAVSVAAEPDRVVLKVSDTGPGVSPESAAQLFDPFYTTKPPGEGTGLGLFLSYGIAETHGGSLSVEPRTGQGATFVLALPKATPGVRAAPARAEPVTKTDGKDRARRILVVDDDAAVRRLVGVLFRHDGHTVDEAESGADALRLAGELEYDLVITDRRAVVGSEPFGVALARARPGWQGRVIVAATDRTSTMKGDWAAALRLLRKPFNLRDLRAAASDVWKTTAA